jgi:hypothetical protein
MPLGVGCRWALSGALSGELPYSQLCYVANPGSDNLIGALTDDVSY